MIPKPGDRISYELPMGKNKVVKKEGAFYAPGYDYDGAPGTMFSTFIIINDDGTVVNVPVDSCAFRQTEDEEGWVDLNDYVRKDTKPIGIYECFHCGQLHGQGMACPLLNVNSGSLSDWSDREDGK